MQSSAPMKKSGLLFRAALVATAVFSFGCGPDSAQPAGQNSTAKQALVEYTLEANQALGVLSAPRFVAGKSTVVIAYLANALVPDPTKHTVAVTRNGEAVVTLTPLATGAATKTLVFACKDLDACGKWAPGTYAFAADIEGVKQTLSATFTKKRGLRALAVPVIVKYGTEQRAPDDKWKKHGEFLRSVWPVADEDFSWSLREPLDLSAQDILTSDGQRAVWQALAALNPAACETNPGATGCYDSIMGFIKSRPGNLQGYTFGLPAVVNVNDDEDAMATVAHEFGHTGPFRLGDEYRGGSYNCDNNPTPASYVGSNFNDGAQMMFSCASSNEVAYDAMGRAGTGTTIPPSVHAYDMTRGLFTKDALSFMGSGSPQAEVWVTPRAYERAFDQATPFAATPGGPPGPVVQLSGWIKTDTAADAGVTVELEPWVTYTGVVPDAPTTPSEYTVRAYNGANAELTVANLTVNFYARDPVRLLPEVAIEGAIAFPAGAVRFDILRGTKVLASVPVTANAPVVTVTAPTGGTLTGKQTISWTGSDADPGTTLYYSVEYCESASSPCDVIDSDLTANQVSADFDALPGSAAAFIRVTATDGLRTTSAQSPSFNVPFKAPEVELLEPDDGEEFPGGSDIIFDAMIFDEQDTTITAKSQLRWSSNVDGDIGTGARIYSSKLSAGKHVVTLTATNSKGKSSTATVNITVTAATGTQPAGCGCSSDPAGLWFGLAAAASLLRRRRS